MSKRTWGVVIGLIAVGGLSVWVLHQWLSADATLPALSDGDLAKLLTEHDRANPTSQTQPAPVVVDPKRTIRLAVGSLGIADDSANRDTADLVVAQLAGATGLELVERQSLELALREMQLSFSGLVRAGDAIRIGKLARADWFLLGSPFKLNGTNAIVVRVVDARTGILHEAAAFTVERDATRLASDLATFVRSCRSNAATAKPRNYLAIGSFEDLSVNNRLAALPGDLCAYLTAQYASTPVTLDIGYAAQGTYGTWTSICIPTSFCPCRRMTTRRSPRSVWEARISGSGRKAPACSNSTKPRASSAAGRKGTVC